MDRFRSIMAFALKPFAIVGPLALVLCSGVLPPARPETGGATLPLTTLIIAAILMLALFALVRMFSIRGLRTGIPGITDREAGVVALLIFLLTWWCFGLSLLAHGPGEGDSIGSLAYINGMFGTLVCTGVLFRWATKRAPAAS